MLKYYKMYFFEKHTADLKIRFEVNDLKEIFQEALNAFNEYLQPQFNSTSSIVKHIKVESNFLETLVVDFLNEVISLIQVEKFLPQQVEIEKIIQLPETFILEAKLIGRKYGKIYKDIKAATYHNLNLVKEKDKLILEVVLDI